MSAWIDFRELRQQLSFEKVLEKHGVEIKRKGEQHHGFCPLPTHKGEKNSPSFSANLEKGIFQCFGCGAKGNVLDFAALMCGKDVSDGKGLREVAVSLRKEFCPDLEVKRNGKKEKPKDEGQGELLPQPTKEERKIVVNQPLDFELKKLDPDHPYFLSRNSV